MANVKRQFVNGVTPKGEARYAFLRKVETYEGQELGYSIQITFDAKTTKEFKAYLEQEFEKASRSLCGECGLKYLHLQELREVLHVAPHAGAWIEICGLSSSSL